MNDTCETCGQPLPDHHTGADIKTLREAAGVTAEELVTHFDGSITARKLNKIEAGTSAYVAGLYDIAKAAIVAITTDRAAHLGLTVGEQSA